MTNTQLVVRSIVIFVGIVIGGLVGTFGGRYIGLKMNQHFLSKEANVRREAFEQTRSFNEAKKQELLKVYREYHSTDDAEKRGALRFYVNQAFADYNIGDLDPELQQFVKECRE